MALGFRPHDWYSILGPESGSYHDGDLNNSLFLCRAVAWVESETVALAIQGAPALDKYIYIYILFYVFVV